MSCPIGVFDSGYGGLTILKDIVKEMPEYDYIYLGDNGFSLGDKLIFKDGNLSINGGGTFSGKLSAASGSFTGDVTANTLTANTSGSIAGWNITNGGMSYDNGTQIVYLLNGGNTNKDFLVVYNSDPTNSNDNYPFWVHADGHLHASDADITGTIKATSGSFTGEVYASKGTFTDGSFSNCEIKDGCWFGDKNTADTKRIKIVQYGEEVYMMKGTETERVGFGGTDGAIWAGAQHSANAPFMVRYNGDVKIKNIAAEGGYIGGFLIDNGDLSGDASTISAKLIIQGGKNVSVEGHTHNAVVSVDGTKHAMIDSSGGWSFAPFTDESLALGKSGHKWGNIYSKNATINTSDENEKEIIGNISKDLENIFMELVPIQYKWKNFSETDHHDRIHFGFGAQTTAKVIESHNIEPFSLSMMCKDSLPSLTADGRNEEWGMRYSELHALEVHMIQKQQKEIEKLKAEIAQLKKAVSAH